MSFHLTAGLILDGYSLIRFLGRGGFGDVWLCRSEAMGGYHAIKFIAGEQASLLEKEYHALALYRKEAARLRSPHLVPIEHINRNQSGLFYVMPLADGVSAIDPSDPRWQPLTLAAIIQARRSATSWFSIQEITAVIQPVLLALQTLSDTGLVHRDVKPDNILFFNGLPCLGDISLLGADAADITRRGTPGYATPSWYVGGHPDMYGAAATLYTLLTGNSPDRMGRSAFLWPPLGENSLSETEREGWKRLHGVIRRTIDEKVAERYVDFRAMADAVTRPTAEPPSIPPPPLPTTPPPTLKAPIVPSKRKTSSPALKAIAVFLCLLATAWLVMNLDSGTRTEQSNTTDITPSDPAQPPPPGAPIHREPPARRETSEPTTNPTAGIERSPRDPNAGSFVKQDTQLALNSLSWFAAESSPLSAAERARLREAVSNIQSCTKNPNTPDFKAAIRFLDNCVSSIPTLKKSRNARLARLVFLLSDGERLEVDRELNDPALLTLGGDNLSYRIELLLRLGGDSAARTLLDNYIGSPGSGRIERSQGFMERARLHAAYASNQEALADAETAIELAVGNPAVQSRRRSELEEIKRDHPGFARFLKTQPGK